MFCSALCSHDSKVMWCKGMVSSCAMPISNTYLPIIYNYSTTIWGDPESAYCTHHVTSGLHVLYCHLFISNCKARFSKHWWTYIKWWDRLTFAHFSGICHGDMFSHTVCDMMSKLCPYADVPCSLFIRHGGASKKVDHYNPQSFYLDHVFGNDWAMSLPKDPNLISNSY